MKSFRLMTGSGAITLTLAMNSIFMMNPFLP